MNARFQGKALRHILLLVVLALVAVGVTFAWFQRTEYRGSEIVYERTLYIPGRELDIQHAYGVPRDGQAGDVDYVDIPTREELLESEGEVTTVTLFTGMEALFTSHQLYPGAVQHFRTTITNNEKIECAFSVYLKNICYSEELQGHVSCVSTNKDTVIINCGDLAQKQEGQSFYCVPLACIADDFRIPAGATVELYWQICIDTDANNDCENARITIDSFQMQNVK